MNQRHDAFYKLSSMLEIAEKMAPQASLLTRRHELWVLTQACLRELARQVETIPDDDEDFFDAAAQALDLFAELLGYIEASQAVRIPHALVRPFEELASPLLPADDILGIIVYYEWGPANYSNAPQLSGRLKREVQVIFSETNEDGPDVPACLACVSFPAAFREDVMLHCSLAHEVGHAIAQHRRDLDALRSIAELDYAMLDPEFDKEKQFDLLRSPVVQRARRVRDRWLLELLADAWGIYLIGPAALLALREFGVIHYPGPTHPPSSLRFRLMAECLQRSGFLEDGKTAVADCEWLQHPLEEVRGQQQDSALPTSEQNEVYPCVYKALISAIKPIADHILDGSHEVGPFDIDSWRCHIDHGIHPLCSRIMHHVPPDRYKPKGRTDELLASLPLIVNAGWAVYLGERWDQLCASFPETGLEAHFAGRKRLNRLLLKAIELTEMSRRWGEQ